VRARALGRRPWGRNSTLFANILNVFLSSRHQIPVLLLPPTITTLSSSFLVVNVFYDFIPLKKEPSNYSKCSAFASSSLLHLFFNSNSVSFVERGAQEYFLPKGKVP